MGHSVTRSSEQETCELWESIGHLLNLKNLASENASLARSRPF